MKIERHIAIEGCIGVGKTTLAEKISQFRRALLLLEDFEKNPFLSEFYADRKSNGLENALQFLLLHCFQIKEMRKLDCAEIITDFTVFKDTIFAEINLLEHAEKEIFDGICRVLHAKLPSPDLVIYIRGSNSLILERVRQRKRIMELETDTTYFENINAAYENFFSTFTGPLYVIEANSYDCIESPECIASLSKTIDAILAQKPQALSEAD